MTQGSAGAPLTVGLLLTAILGSIPILGIMVWGAVKILGPVGQAVARRIGGGDHSENLEGRLLEMERQLDVLRTELAETHERLDFSERLLAQGRGSHRLPAPD
jgi:hypothetical protein